MIKFSSDDPDHHADCPIKNQAINSTNQVIAVALVVTWSSGVAGLDLLFCNLTIVTSYCSFSVPV